MGPPALSSRRATSRAPSISTGPTSWSTARKAPTRSSWPRPDRAAAALGRAGVGDGTTVVLYDDTLSLYASRVWWSLRVYGLESARILDGGLPGLGRGGPPISNATLDAAAGDVHAARAVALAPDHGGRARPARLAGRTCCSTPAPRPSTAASRATPAASATSRAPSTSRSRRCTCPAASASATATSCAACCCKANVTRGRRLVCYDGSGVAAAKLAFVLTLLGHDDVAVYDGGWAEWGDRLDLPVDR